MNTRNFVILNSFLSLFFPPYISRKRFNNIYSFRSWSPYQNMFQTFLVSFFLRQNTFCSSLYVQASNAFTIRRQPTVPSPRYKSGCHGYLSWWPLKKNSKRFILWDWLYLCLIIICLLMKMFSAVFCVQAVLLLSLFKWATVQPVCFLPILELSEKNGVTF